MSALIEMLQKARWTQELASAEFARVVSEMTERRVLANSFVVRVGEPADHWIGIIEGLCKMSVTSPEGRIASFTGVTTGGWFGEGSLLKRSVWRYDAIALHNAHIACMPRTTFERLLATNFGFNRFIMNMLNARLSLFIGLAEHDRLLTPDARVARCLASLFDPDLYPDRGRSVDLTQEEVGLLSAVGRQRTNRALKLLQTAGLLRVEFKKITVLDLDGLRRFRGAPAARWTLKPHGARRTFSVK